MTLHVKTRLERAAFYFADHAACFTCSDRSDRRLQASPNDVLRRVLDIAGLAVQAVLRVDLQTVLALFRFDELVHARRAEARFRTGVGLQIQREGDACVLERQMRRLILFVIRVRDEHRRETVERELAIRLRILDWRALRCRF